MDLCGPMRLESINGKQYVLVIVDDYSRYTWVHFLRSKDEVPEEIKTFLKKLQFYCKLHSSLTPQKNGVVEQRNRMLVEEARTMLIFFLVLHYSYGLKLSVIPKNDREDIGKLGAKGLDLTYAPSTITSQKPIERDLDILFEAMYDDYIGGQPSAALRTAYTAPVNQNF
ncbi:retrovirus-related pol polyprotein from transposon TNT 1-94 [Tanacetum coccineum]